MVNNNKNGGAKNKPSNKLQQIGESPSINQSESNCFFGIKSYLKDFYAQKDDSDQESIIGSTKGKKVNRYSSSDSDTESDDESDRYKNIIKNCDKLKKKSRKKMKKIINYSRDQWNLFNTNDSDLERYNQNGRSRKHYDEERQEYKSNKPWSVYIWRSIFMIGCVLLITGLLMAISFLIGERQVEIGKQEEMEIIDRSALRFNQILNQLRAFSLALIAVGLLLFLSTLLLPQLIGVSLNCFNFGKKQKDQTFASFFNERTDSDEETCSKIYVKCENKKIARKSPLNEPLEDGVISKIPILEEIQSVQPEREKEESILTSDGFAKIH